MIHSLRRFLPFTTLLLLGSCTNGASEGPAEPAAKARQAVPDELVAQSWQVRMSDAALRAPYEAHAGWARLFTRQHTEALAAFAAEPGDGRGLARVHLEYAEVYRQAALLAARATVAVYGEDRQDEDPAEVSYLVEAAAGLLGDCATARSAAAELALPADSPLAGPARTWQGWLAACPSLPDEVAPGLFPGQPSLAPAPGTDPGVGELPHYRLAERSEEVRLVEAADPTALFLLSRWHEQAARAAAPPADAEVISLLLAPWSLPGEPSPVVERPEVADPWLFAGFLLAPADAGFLVDARARGLPAVDAWRDRSPLAAAVAPAIVGGQVQPDTMLDQAAWLGGQVERAMAASVGQEEGFHKGFAGLAMLGALRAGMVVADANGQYRDAGIIRINALERSTGPGADPVFAISVAAWDTGNRNPLRAQDILHSLIGRFPAVEAARYPLGALHIRLSRNAAPATPVH